MARILLTTTGTLSVVPIADLGAVEFIHPQVGFVLFDNTLSSEFTLNEILASKDLVDAVVAGYITLESGLGVSVSTNSEITRIFFPITTFSGGTTTFSGETTTGIVPDPITENNKFLRDDGTWATAFGSGTLSSGSTITPPNLSGVNNNYNPTSFVNAYIIRLNTNVNGTSITGFQAGSNGDEKIIMNISDTNKISLDHNSGSSAVGNRIFCSLNKTYSLNKNASVKIVWDVTGEHWRIMDGST